MRVLEIARSVVPTEDSKRAYLDLSVYLNEDGTFSGDVVLPSGPRRLPQDCRIPQPDRFFDIPEKLAAQKDYLRAAEHPTELVVTLRDSQFRLCCSFFKSQLELASPLRGALEDLESKIAQITDPNYVPKPLTPAEERASLTNRMFALHEAALTSDTELIDEIMKLHPEQLHIENGNGFTPLEQAVWTGSSTAVERLIGHGANVNVTDGFGQTPLHIACTGGELRKVVLLVEKGADINATRLDGFRPIHYALIANRKEIVQYLRDRGARFDPDEEITKEALKTAKRWKHDV